MKIQEVLDAITNIYISVNGFKEDERYAFTMTGDEMNKDLIEHIIRNLFDAEIILGGVIWPIIISFLKWVIDIGIIRVVVPKYNEKYARRYIWDYITELWKIIIAPLGFCFCILYILMAILDSIWDYNMLFGILGLLLVFICVLVLPGSLTNKFHILFKSLIEMFMCSILFLFLYAEYEMYDKFQCFFVICVFIQITCFNYHLFVDAKYTNLKTIIIKIIEYILSIIWYVCIWKKINDTLSIGLMLLTTFVIYLDMKVRKEQNEQPIEKKITICGDDDDKVYNTYDSIKMSYSGCLHFTDKNKRKIIVSVNAIKKITFEYPSELRLSRKIEYLKWLNDSTKTLEGEWYVKSVTTDWLWICSWENGKTKNAIYPQKNVLWSAKNAKD